MHSCLRNKNGGCRHIYPLKRTVSRTCLHASVHKSCGDVVNRGISYTLDGMGNRVREEVKDASNQIALTTRYTYTAAGELAAILTLLVSPAVVDQALRDSPGAAALRQQAMAGLPCAGFNYRGQLSSPVAN